MKIFIDEKKVKKLGKIGTILRWTSIGFLVIALFAVFSPNSIDSQLTMSLYFGVLIVGVLISSISNSLSSRYGKSPRPDELLDKTFKGLDDKFSFYHYQTTIPHLLVGPAGIWSIIPSFVDGEVVFDEKKGVWSRKSGSFINKFLSREAFGRPDKELVEHSREYSKMLKDINIPEELSIKAAVILLSKNVTISGEPAEEDILILPYEKAKDKFRKLAKSPISIPEEIQLVLKNYE